MWSSASTEALFLSIRVALAATVAIAIIGGPIAYWLARQRSRWARWIQTLLLLPLVVPPVATGYLLLLLLSPRGLLGSWLTKLGVTFALDWKGAVLASAIAAFPLFLTTARVAFEAADERLEEAARTLKANPLRVLTTITLPPALPGLLAASTLAFARAFGEFGATVMLAGNIPGQTRTLPQAIYSALIAGHDDTAFGLALVAVFVGLTAMAAAQYMAFTRGDALVRGPAHARV